MLVFAYYQVCLVRWINVSYFLPYEVLHYVNKENVVYTKMIYKRELSQQPNFSSPLDLEQKMGQRPNSFSSPYFIYLITRNFFCSNTNIIYLF